jgi:hypothetical protein
MTFLPPIASLFANSLPVSCFNRLKGAAPPALQIMMDADPALPGWADV